MLPRNKSLGTNGIVDMDSVNEETSTRSRRQKSSGGGGGGGSSADRISDLQEHIIYYILSLLPTKYAFLTSFLSKSWGLRWTDVTTFDFDDSEWPNARRYLSENCGVSVKRVDFVEFVDMVFANHKAEFINRLRLEWKSANVRSGYLNVWINSAIFKHVKDIDLATIPRLRHNHSDENFKFSLPGALYTCGTLEALKLRGPFLVQLPHAVHLPKLRVLKLYFVRFECDESVDKLVSGCPVLASFTTKRFHYHDDQEMLFFRVSSSSLKRLHIYFDDGCECKDIAADLKIEIDTPALETLFLHNQVSEKCCIKDGTSLHKVELDTVSWDGSNEAVGLVEAFDGVKLMTLRSNTVIGLGASTKKLSANFERLTKLVMESEFSGRGWSVLVNLIECCVNLEVLDIDVFELAEEEDGIEDLSGTTCWSPPPGCAPRCLGSSLRQFNFRSFVGTEDEMSFLKFILDHGLLMERVAIFEFEDLVRVAAEKRNEILKKMLMLPRASPTCKISFS